MNTRPPEILDQLDGQWQKMALFILWKLLPPGASVVITANDMEACQKYYDNNPHLFTHGHAESIEFSIVTEERAKQLAELDALARRNPQ